jgi:ankyrin repeat protein
MNTLTEENLSKLNEFYINRKSNVENFLINKPNTDLNKLFCLFCQEGYYFEAKILLQYYSNINIHSNNNLALKLACINGQFDIIKWLLNFDENNSVTNINWAFQIICRRGYLIIAQWLHNSYSNINYNLAFKISCGYGNLDMVKWLLSIENNNINISDEDGEAFYLACKNHYYEVTDFLLEKNIIIDYEIHFYRACIENLFDYAKYLVKNNKDIDFSKIANICFFETCLKGNLDMLSWLLTIIKNDINIDYNNAFLAACKNGHLHVMKWLLSIKNDKININESDDCVFKMACENGYLNIVKWLLSIDNNNIKIFPGYDIACKFDNQEITCFLLTLDPKRKLNIIDECSVKKIKFI